MLSIQIDTKSLELVIYPQFHNIKLSFFASHMKLSFPLCTFLRCCTVIRFSRVRTTLSCSLNSRWCLLVAYVLHRCPKQNGKFVETCQKFVPLSIKLWHVFSTIFWLDFFGGCRGAGARGLVNCQRPAVAFGNDKSSFRQLPLVELTWRYNNSFCYFVSSAF